MPQLSNKEPSESAMMLAYIVGFFFGLLILSAFVIELFF